MAALSVKLLYGGCTSDGKYVVLGFYDAIAQKLDWYEKERFFGNRGPPPDSTRIRRWPITVSFKVNCSSHSQLANTQYVIHITHYIFFIFSVVCCRNGFRSCRCGFGHQSAHFQCKIHGKKVYKSVIINGET